MWAGAAGRPAAARCERTNQAPPRGVCAGEFAHAPAFLWLLRDFQLQLRDGDGRQLAPRDYVEQALDERRQGNSANSNQVGVPGNAGLALLGRG
jgi:hypothetical protein